jgi:hypothetical protein
VLVNIVTGILYAHQTYPGSRVAGKLFGGIAFADVPARLGRLHAFPDKMTLAYKQATETVDSDTLGLGVDNGKVTQAVRQRHWLPIWNLIEPPDTLLALSIDDRKMREKLGNIAETHKEVPVDARIEQRTDGFVLVSDKQGSSLAIEASRTAVVSAATNGRARVALVVKGIEPKVSNASLTIPFKQLQTARSTVVKYTYGGKTFLATPADITGWYRRPGTAGVSRADMNPESSGESGSAGGFVLWDPVLRGFITAAGKQAGIQTLNVKQAMDATHKALGTGNPLEFALEATPGATPRKTLHYCTALRGVDAAYLPILEQALVRTYSDDRGWGLKGTIDFMHVSSGCDFTVWLSTANQMASFGSICDSVWNCQVPPNIVINFDRWQHASDPWSAAAGNLDDYRSMAINHETGHWLGFGHAPCGGAGQPAPVMEQQSIDLQGCVFNPWPLPSELAILKSRLGI